MPDNALDIVLINPGAAIQVYQSLGERLAAKEPPLWAGLMATFVRRHGVSVQIIDANAESLGPEETARRVRELNPRLVAVVVYGHQPSASTQTMPAAGAVCRSVRQEMPEVKIIMIGGHVAALPERTLREEVCDFTCTGEGPYTLLALLEALKSCHSDDYSKVLGLCYRDQGKVVVNSPAPILDDLNIEMPGVAWALLPMHQYRAHNWHCFGGLKREPYASIYTTLGCPYHCTFCCIQAPFRGGEKISGKKGDVNSYRFWSPQLIAREIDHLVGHYGVQNIKFADEVFVLNPGHVRQLCDLLIERRYGLNIWAYARVDSVRDDMPEKLKQAGVNWLAFGIESGSAHVRDGVKKAFHQKLVFETLDKVRQAGIHVIGNFIFGLPDDDLDSMQETLDIALELNCEFANFYCTMAYPGSELYTQAVKEKWPLPNHWNEYSQHARDTFPLATKYISARDVLAFRDQAFDTYFKAPRYLDRIKKIFGADTLTQIQEMTAHKLERKILLEKN